MRALLRQGRLLTALVFCLAFLTVAPAYALERILSYHSDIQISADGSMRVIENIRVIAEGNQIRRGIYREFPTTYRDRYGNSVKVAFDILEVMRDGKPESWHQKRLSNGVRVYAGKSDVILKPGKYTYTITYRTDRQIGFFADHDELYWNVTGNGWDFPIDRASASAALPEALAAENISLDGFTGPMGSVNKNFTTSIGTGSALIETTGNLAPREGLTLVMSWPKGVINEPGYLRRLLYLLGDNLGLALSLIALCGSAAYLFEMWRRHGRDPGKGVIFPHYEPPAGYSPGSARYINEMGYDKETLTAAILNLAVKGYLEINCDDDEYSLHRKPSSEQLAPPEHKLLNKLFNQGSLLRLENANHALISAARSAHKAALKREYLDQYFKTNTKLLLPSFIVCAVLLLITLITATASMVPLAMGFFAMALVVHILFAYLLKAPSARGRRLMDKLEGFKLYLEVAEKDDLNLKHPPEKTPELFEKYLPYAIALGVEQAWAEQFNEVFARLTAQEGRGYHPVWYHGNFNSSRLNHFTSNVSTNLSSAISSAATAPGSSSGSGGGGSSGGGGGGGGGGGW